MSAQGVVIEGEEDEVDVPQGQQPQVRSRTRRATNTRRTPGGGDGERTPVGSANAAGSGTSSPQSGATSVHTPQRGRGDIRDIRKVLTTGGSCGLDDDPSSDAFLKHRTTTSPNRDTRRQQQQLGRRSSGGNNSPPLEMCSSPPRMLDQTRELELRHHQEVQAQYDHFLLSLDQISQAKIPEIGRNLAKGLSSHSVTPLPQNPRVHSPKQPGSVGSNSTSPDGQAAQPPYFFLQAYVLQRQVASDVLVGGFAQLTHVSRGTEGLTNRLLQCRANAAESSSIGNVLHETVNCMDGVKQLSFFTKRRKRPQSVG